MNSKQRLADLEKLLDVEYKRLGFFQLKISEGVSADQEFYYTQQINNYIMPRIRQYEEEYYSILAQEVDYCEVAEVDASQAIVEVVPKLEQIVNNSTTNYPNELMQKLQKILDTLNEQERPAANKLIAAVPVIPGIVSYQLEIDTEISLKRVFEGIRQLLTNAIKKNHNYRM
jgi:hypothetical protein